MEAILNITNGDSAVKIMQEVGLPGDFLPWRDVLHDGPVPAGLSLERLSQLRARFIAGQGWGSEEGIRTSFIERDKTLKAFADYERVILWFEHDLYDQLQILQLLDWFAEQAADTARLSMICTEQYLGQASSQQMQELLAFELPVTGEQLALACRAWAAFRSPTPEAWRALLDEDTSALPFLHGAVLRLLEEYPACSNGLSRTAQKALQIIKDGEGRPGRVFGLYQETEERRYQGDSSFWVMLHQLLESDPPLLSLPPGKQLTLPTSPDQWLSITPAGNDVLAEKRNWLQMTSLDRWIGGVHLTPDKVWCWDAAAMVNRKG